MRICADLHASMQQPISAERTLQRMVLPYTGTTQQHQRQGFGELLLADALQRCLRLSDEIGMVGVIVDAKDERARGWYLRYEFEQLPDSPLTLWIPAAAIRKLC